MRCKKKGEEWEEVYLTDGRGIKCSINAFVMWNNKNNHIIMTEEKKY